MPSIPTHEQLFTELKACVLMPTYNNAGTLAAVINDVLKYTSHLIVINDGSTDNTKEILAGFPNIFVGSYTPNRGKGIALMTGIRKAAELGYDYAITIDSDGQHFANDLPKFLDKIKTEPGSLIVGARNLQQENMPGKNTFANKFSNFWYWAETGIRLPDTQSGYRLYPVQQLAKKRYITGRYEFEIEVMVRAAWSGIPVTSIPISVYYPPAGERISHFRPAKDFTRISILNTFLVLISILYIKPRNFFRKLFSKDGWKDVWRMIFVNPQESNHMKAASVGFGVFMGIVPVWGFQLAIGIPLALLFRLNKALFLIAANISIFPPVIWFASLATGKWLLGDTDWSFSISGMTMEYAKKAGVAFFLGGTVLSVVAGIVFYLVTYFSLLLARGKR
jgi:glycosyltransferase involved in cell wall biosynthesis